MKTKFVKIKSIKKTLALCKVYDLTISNAKNFFTNIGLIHNCPFRCIYCFSDSLKATLYSSFFDNSKDMGIRSCPPAYFKKELDKYFERAARSDLFTSQSEIQRAITNRIPLRIGIRFEDFLPLERKRGVSLELLQYLSQNHYPVMINTKSDLVSEDSYLRALSENPAKSAVHMTLISSNDRILKKIEPGAPSYARRLNAMRLLSSAGVRVVARIEPFMVFVNDDPEDVAQYIEEVYAAGVRHITFDTYSYSANNAGIRANFNNLGFDFSRIYNVTSDSQAIGSLLLGKFMDMFREKGFRCSTFDLGNVPYNGDEICCEVGDWFTDSKFNVGSVVSAIRFVQKRAPKSVGWNEYDTWVQKSGGFLSESLQREVKGLWNLFGNTTYSPEWAQGLIPTGVDREGMLTWKYEPEEDFRMKILEGCL